MFVKLAFLLVLGLATEKVYADEPERIVGGSDASVGEFPYQVSLRIGGFHICGGSIVSERHILTAAHCVFYAKIEMLTVMTGAVTLNDPLGQIHSVKNISIHPSYIGERVYSWVHDAAVITLTEPMEFNAYQRPIPIAMSDPPLNAPLILSGWGALNARGDGTNQLQKATLYYISNEQCQNDYPRQPIYYTHLCVLHSTGIGACSGDSGGPLVYNGELVGIASWVVLCARGVPDVFTRARFYDSFVVSVMRSQS